MFWYVSVKQIVLGRKVKTAEFSGQYALALGAQLDRPMDGVRGKTTAPWRTEAWAKIIGSASAASGVVWRTMRGLR